MNMPRRQPNHLSRSPHDIRSRRGQQMAFEIMVGLPHLRPGPILDRARTLRCATLVSANALSSWSRRQGWPEWLGWKWPALRNAEGLRSICLDSAGFVASAQYGGFPWTIPHYVALAAAYPFQWWASIDYCTEAEIAGDREEVLDRISRTIRANLDCHAYGRDAGIERTMLPVIQGRTPADYARCLDGIAGILTPCGTIGVGSMCRREIAGPEGLIAIIDHLDQILPAGIMIHAFGVKGTAIPYLLPFSHRIASVDSQAYGIAARRHAFRHGVSKSDRMVADAMEQWLIAQRARLRHAPQHLAMAALHEADRPPDDPWERAIVKARAELRALIETGDLLGPVL